jgi:hypothetical protein
LHLFSKQQNTWKKRKYPVAKWLLSIGEDKAISVYDNIVQLPDNIQQTSVRNLEDSVYNDFLNNYRNPVYLRERAILGATNACVKQFNDDKLQQIPGPNQDRPGMFTKSVTLSEVAGAGCTACTTHTEDLATFDFEGPANCFVDASTTVDCGTAPAGTATAPVDFVLATKVDCGSAPVTAVAAAPTQTNMLFGNTQVDTTFNARAFAMSLKIGEQRKYEGVGAAEETTILCAQFRTTANIKSKLQVENAFNGCLASTKRYHELGIKQKNPLYDPYTFVPDFEYGFIIVCRGEKTEWKWLIVTRCITQFLILYRQKLHKAVLKRLKEKGVPDSSIWVYE